MLITAETIQYPRDEPVFKVQSPLLGLGQGIVGHHKQGFDTRTHLSSIFLVYGTLTQAAQG